MGRATMGVKGIDIVEGDAVVGFAVTDSERNHVLAVCENGFGKRTQLEEFRKQNRGGKGIILIDASERNGPVVDIKLVGDADQVMLITDRGQLIRTGVAEIRETGRNAQGVKLMTLDEGERIVALERMAESAADETAGGDSLIPAEGSLPPDGSAPTDASVPPDAPDASDSVPPGDGSVN
mgnify:CR=1 FL=1